LESDEIDNVGFADNKKNVTKKVLGFTDKEWNKIMKKYNQFAGKLIQYVNLAALISVMINKPDDMIQMITPMLCITFGIILEKW